MSGSRLITVANFGTSRSLQLQLAIAVLSASLFVVACSSKKTPRASDAGSDAAMAVDDGGADAAPPEDGGSRGNDSGQPAEDDGGVAAPGCSAFGAVCAKASDCCSGLCDAQSHTCGSSVAQCSPMGAACAGATECCSLSCISGECSSSSCMSDGASCAVGAECCSGSCDQGSCTPLSTSCKTGGNECTDNGQCCSKLCDGGHCSLGSSFCVQTSDVCARDSECCSSRCVVAAGATLGTCGEPPSGASNCSGQLDGTVCNGCGSCCSRLCAPYGDSGTSVCQPATGCHPNGGLCREDNDCCGAAGTGLPGEGKVVCQKESGQSVGICRNPTGCNPQGNVCHFKDYACSISSARNACCAAPGNSGVCQLDRLGVPRCNGLGDSCRAGGDTCASSDDCCDDRPCVADAVGVLRCFKSEKGDPSCVPAAGSCTVTADCCRGSTCLSTAGSTRGTCSTPDAPPAAGSGGAGGTGGTSIGSGAGAGGTPACGQYGQQCLTNADCCTDIPCLDGYCVYPLL